MAKALKKAPKKVDHPIWLRFGSGKEFGEPRGYPTESKARQAIGKEIADLVVWCQRHNHDGLTALAEFSTLADKITFHAAREQIECEFDERYKMRIVVEYWRK